MTLTALLFQPAEFAAGLGVAVVVGTCVSMRMSETVALAVFPARSVKE
jgi:hypothetical protein